MYHVGNLKTYHYVYAWHSINFNYFKVSLVRGNRNKRRMLKFEVPDTRQCNCLTTRSFGSQAGDSNYCHLLDNSLTRVNEARKLQLSQPQDLSFLLLYTLKIRRREDMKIKLKWNLWLIAPKGDTQANLTFTTAWKMAVRRDNVISITPR